MASSIEWLGGGETWNPIRARLKNGHPFNTKVPQKKVGWACVRISPGCQNCYSEKQNKQCGTNKTRAGTGLEYTVPALQMVELFLDEETLLKPLHWKKGKLIFPASMTDWMADFVPDEWRDKMLAVMALTPQHTYLTLTKRADRQREYLNDPETRQRVAVAMVNMVQQINRESGKHKAWVLPLVERPDSTPEQPTFWTMWPLPNLWLGVSAENQEYADTRIPRLLSTPVAIRWVSLEPLLGPTDISLFGRNLGQDVGLDWGVIGLESGGKARPGNIEWIRHLITQFRAAGVPVFVKQLGAKPYLHKQDSVHIEKPGMKFSMQSLEINSTFKLKDPKGGDPSEWPKDLQVRDYPQLQSTKETA